jgi:dolichyl-phosphate beta-glucosyltransferase
LKGLTFDGKDHRKSSLLASIVTIDSCSNRNWARLACDGTSVIERMLSVNFQEFVQIVVNNAFVNDLAQHWKQCSWESLHDCRQLAFTIIVMLGSVLVLFVTGFTFQPALLARRQLSHATIQEDSVVVGKRIIDDNNISNDSSSQNTDFALSIVIPAYNEADRLPIMFEAAYAFLCQRRSDVCSAAAAASTSKHNKHENNPPSSSFELIVVDDGSTDRTIEVVKQVLAKDLMLKIQQRDQMTTKSDNTQGDVLRLISLEQNQGKGAAVKAGMIRARGRYTLMADADGATDINDLLKLFESMNSLLLKNDEGGSKNNNMAAVLGSRAHLQDKDSEVKAQRSKVRTILMVGFHLCVTILCSNRIKDTQCGFKLFTREASQILFGNLHLQRWAFDIELVVMAELLGVSLDEVPVNWREVEGSKLDTGSKLTLIWVSISMLRDMLCVRLCYTLGLWRL